MCYLCCIIAWTLDMFQRIITFGLMCCLGCAILIGLGVAIAAGVAYGYNYSMAEFITLTKSDVTVFMRRGQFYDDPDFLRSATAKPMPSKSPKILRSGANSMDGSVGNITTDYQDQNVNRGNIKPLSDAWIKAHDTRKYAEKLTKYSTKQPRVEILNSSIQVITMGPVTIFTNMLRSDTPNIVMRKFQPLDDIKVETTTSTFETLKENLSDIENDFYKDSSIYLDTVNIKTNIGKDKQKASKPIHYVSPDIKISVGDKLKGHHRKSQKRVENSTTKSLFYDDISEEVDEDEVVYKPV